MNKMKKQLAVAVTVALLALPLGSALAQESGNDTPVVVATTTTTATTTATTELQALELLEAAEVAVTAYEAGAITTLAEVTTAEGLKSAAVTAVEAVSVGNLQTALELRLTTRAEAIATTKTELQDLEAVAALEAAEVAVTAYEAGTITTLTEVATAEGLKAAAVTAVEAVGEGDVQTALELRVTTRAAAIEAAKTTLSVPVVDPDGKIVIPSTEFSDFIDKLQLALAFDPVRKGELTKRHALKKLAQAQKFMKDGNTEASKICFTEYKDKIAEAQAFLLEVEDVDSETAKALAEALVKVEADNVQVLTNLVDKIPPQAAQKLALNVVRTMEKAVVKIQEEEAAAVIPVVTPVVTPVVVQSVVKEVTPIVKADSEKKYLEKQAKTALEEFKKSVNVKDIDQKAKDYQCTTEQNKLDLKQKWETQKNIAPTYRTSDNNKDDHQKQDDHKKDDGGDNRRDHN